jgi:hypothetical protein
VWVLQELALSQKPIIQCGTSRVKWATLCRAVGVNIENKNLGLNSRSLGFEADNLFKLSDQPSALQLLRQMQKIRQVIQVNQTNQALVDKPLTLLELLVCGRGLDGTDPRDMVYAHIGMLYHVREDDVDIRDSALV